MRPFLSHVRFTVGALVCVGAMSAASTSVAQSKAPPVAAVHNVSDIYFGEKVDDPYRHFENKADPEVASWMKAHSAHARATLDRIPGRKKLLDNIVRYDASVSDRVTQVRRVAGEVYFMERRGVADNQFKLTMRQGLTGKDKVLFDPGLLEKRTRKPHAINWYSPSPDGSLVAVGVSQQGSEAATLSVLNARTGKAIGAPITRADFGGVDWTPDSKSLVFTRLQALGKGMAETQKYQHSQTYLLKVGNPLSSARPVFGTATQGLDIGAAELPFVGLTHDGRWALGYAVNGTQRELGLFIASQKSLLAGKPKWQRVVSAAHAVTGVAYFDNTLYMVSYKGASRSRVLALNLDAPDMAAAKEIVAESERVVVNVVAAADALYIETRDGNVKRLYKRAYSATASPVEVALPVQGSFELTGEGVATADPRLPGLVLELQSWTRARQVFTVAADGSVSNTALQPAGPFDAPADIVATEVKVKSHDGAMVPLSIIHRKGVVLDASHPTLLYGYASYGITEEPFFSIGRLAWLDAGGVFAVANPRGSSVYGQDWYKAGFQSTKPNTWKDFIACAEYLIAQKYTQPSKLGILGGSAGGILVGRAMTERPDLFAAVIPAVGALDSLRFETTPNGVPNIPEFGSAKTEAGFKALLAMSTYANVRPAAYPAVLLTHGVNDPRVEVWQSTKTAARLMAATTSGKPVLLRLDFDAGHGVGSTKTQQFEERADMYAFLLWQMGVAGFQP